MAGSRTNWTRAITDPFHYFSGAESGGRRFAEEKRRFKRTYPAIRRDLEDIPLEITIEGFPTDIRQL
jgi:hypothetical protein